MGLRVPRIGPIGPKLAVTPTARRNHGSIEFAGGNKLAVGCPATHSCMVPRHLQPHGATPSALLGGRVMIYCARGCRIRASGRPPLGKTVGVTFMNAIDDHKAIIGSIRMQIDRGCAVATSKTRTCYEGKWVPKRYGLRRKVRKPSLRLFALCTQVVLAIL